MSVALDRIAPVACLTLTPVSNSNGADGGWVPSGE
jgi:hypothetical protein